MKQINQLKQIKGGCMAGEVKDKSIRDMPVTLWNRFAGECKTRGMTVTQGAIEAFTDWLNKKGGKV